MTDTLDDDGDLLPIGTFAREVRLAVSAVRFYDDCGLLPPAFVDPASGYRYYTAEQVDRGRLIRDLRAAEMSIAQIRAVLDAPAAEASALLAQHRAALDRRLAQAKQRLAQVAAALTERETDPMPATCVLSASEFALAVRQVAPSAAPLGTAPNQDLRIIEGVLLTVDDGALRLVATDRYRLAIREIVPAVADGGDARAVVEVADLRAACDGLGDDVTISIATEAVSIRSNGTTSDLRTLTAAPFPPFERLLPESAALVHRALVPVAALQERLEDLSDLGVGALGFDGRVTIGPVGRATQEIAGSEASGPPVEIGINPTFLVEAAQLAEGPELLIEASGPVAPLVVRSATDGSYTCLIMPVRIDFPLQPQNLNLEPDDYGRPRGWQAPPPSTAMAGAAVSSAVSANALTITSSGAREDWIPAWQVIDASEVRSRTVSFAATITCDGDAAGRLALEALEGDSPLAAPGDGRQLSDEVASGTSARVVVTAAVPEAARWLRLAVALRGRGQATFRDLTFEVA